jgi:choline dehydrogenase
VSVPGEPDYIVVGAGAAGAALAGGLAADPSTRVLLLEAGPPDKKLDVRVPAAFPKLMRTDFDWGDDTVPQPQLGDREIVFPLGRGLGGSTSINAQMYVRGHPADFDEWGEAAGPEWSWASLLPHFRALEGNTRGGDDFHGADGPLHVTEQRDPNPLTRAFVAACEELGYASNDDVNGSDQEGAGLAQVSQLKGRRWSAADAFIRPAGQNLEVLTGAQALAVTLDGPRVTGVTYERDGRTESASAGREVVLCAGAIGSPHLLMCSGIGPREHLAERGVEVRHDLPGVGQGLTDHPFATLTFGCDRAVSLKSAESPIQLARYFLRRKGLLTSNIGEGVLFTRTDPGLPAPDLELVFGPVVWTGQGLEPPPRHGFAIGPVALKPGSRGSVRLRSPDPRERPAIDPNYLDDPDDLRVLVEGARIAKRLAATRALQAEGAEELAPTAGVDDPDALADAVRQITQTIYHPVGTCRMGADAGAVVDPSLRVRGVEGLRVADASIMPSIVRGHTQAASCVIGARAAELLRSDA